MRPFDATKFRKSLTKGIDGLGYGFNDPTDWISTGNYTLNYLLSGDFEKGIPMGKVTCFAGSSGSGKSFICAGNLVKAAQDKGWFVVLIDTENALDEAWLKALNVDTSEDKILRLSMSMINDVGKTLFNFFKEYKDTPEEERQKVLIVVDSLGALLSDIQVDQFSRGDMKGDFGHKPRALKSLVMNSVNMIGNLNVGLVVTNHTYESQDMFDPDDKIAGGQGFIYAASMVVAIKRLKLKEKDDTSTDKISSKVTGIRAACKIMKTRYAKPFESVQIQIPYERGMDPYSGLFDMLEGKDLLVKSGNSYIYTMNDGKELKYFKKHYEENKEGVLDLIMKDMMTPGSKLGINKKINITKEIKEPNDD